jgi:REP element-mobilizing transposase RayT
MGRAARQLPDGCSFPITLRCNSRAFLIARGVRRDLLLAVLRRGQEKFGFRLHGICLMANHLHLLLQPPQGRDLPRIMQWIGWYSAMALNRLTGRCGHFWEPRYFSTPIEAGDRRRVLATLRTIHANPKAAGVRKGFHDPWSNYGHYERLEGDGLSEWHPVFLQLAPTLEGCARRFAHYCRRYRPRAKLAPKAGWGSRLLQRDGGSGGKGATGRQGVAAGQQLLPWAGGGAYLPLPMEWHQLAESFRRANGARGSPWEGF